MYQVMEEEDEGMAGADAAPLIRMRGIAKRFPGVVALDDVDLELRRGEVHALTGENGSGKSTLAKILYGALQPDAGTIEVDGEEMAIGTPSRALSLGIVAISQEITLAPTLSVAENVLMGRLPLTRFGTVDWGEARRRARVSLDRLGVHVDPDRIVGELSVELQQEVEIARAVSADSRVLILDEATSSLSEAATVRLMEIVEGLAREGVAVLMISHRMPELYRLATTATVLRDGKLMATVPLPDTPESRLVRLMVGRELGDLYRKRRIARGEPRLQVDELATDDGLLLPTSLTVHGGEILGIAGLVGSGKAQLALALAGGLPCRGQVRVDGRPVSLGDPRRAMNAGIAHVPEDRKSQALFRSRSVGQNLSAAAIDRLTRFGVALDLRAERSLVRRTIEQFHIVARSPDSPITSLSGGNQQKVILGRWFARDPSILVLSEPTRGIDVGAKSEIYGFIQDIADRGAAVVMVSSELPELIGIADRIAVMFQGQLRATFDAGVDEETVAHVAVAGRAEETEVTT